MHGDKINFGTAQNRRARAVAARLGYAFANPALLDLALTHSSFAREAAPPVDHNERLEFLGDAVLETCVSAALYARFPNAREGDLTRMRAALVNERALAAAARKLGLGEALKLGVGEEKQGGRDRDSVLSDALEAVLGAVFQDGGLEAAQNCVAWIFEDQWPEKEPGPAENDVKSRLQEVTYKIFKAYPVYSSLRESGPEHAKIYEVEVKLPNGARFRASNGGRKKAERDAAAKALAALRDTP